MNKQQEVDAEVDLLFPAIRDLQTRKVLSRIHETACELLAVDDGIVSNHTQEYKDRLAFLLCRSDVRQVFLSLAQLSEQGQQAHGSYKKELDSLLDSKSQVIHRLNGIHEDFSVCLLALIGSVGVFGNIMIPALEKSVED